MARRSLNNVLLPVSRFGGLAVALILLIGPAVWLYKGSPSSTSVDALQRFRLHGFYLGQDLAAIQRAHPDLQLSLVVGEDNRVKEMSGYLFAGDGARERAWSAVLSLAPPAAGQFVFSIIIHQENVTEAEARTAIEYAFEELGKPREAEDETYVHPGQRHRARIYEWGRRGTRYYRLTVETIRFAGEPAVTRLQHIAFDAVLYRKTPLGAAENADSVNGEGAGDGENRDD
jgi:hypothetical protein